MKQQNSSGDSYTVLPAFDLTTLKHSMCVMVHVLPRAVVGRT